MTGQPSALALGLVDRTTAMAPLAAKMNEPARKIILGFLALSAVLVSGAQADQYDDAMAVLERQEYHAAFRLPRPLAEQGHSKAPFILGTLHLTGKGAEQNFAEAAKWFRRAAEHGDANAGYALGAMYTKGRAVPQNSQQAAEWFLWAAEEGHASAQHEVASRYAVGNGVHRDYLAAAVWFYRAAEQGVSEAQLMLGTMLALGKGVPVDKVAAYAWATLAATGDSSKRISENAIALRQSTAKSMTPGQIEAAEKNAKEWRPKSERLARQSSR